MQLTCLEALLKNNLAQTGFTAIFFKFRCRCIKSPLAKNFIGHDHMILKYNLVEGYFSMENNGFQLLQIILLVKNGETLRLFTIRIDTPGLRGCEPCRRSPKGDTVVLQELFLSQKSR